MKKLILLFAVLISIAWMAAEKREHAEDVVLKMSYEDYDTIRSILGDEASIIKIAE